jgi:hypothetical protein
MVLKTWMAIAGATTSAALLSSALPAQAVSFTLGGQGCATSTCVDFAEAGYSVTGGSVIAPATSVTDEYLTPGTDSGTEGSVESYNVLSTGSSPDGVTPYLEITGLTNTFEMFWGSVDTYNQVEFFSGGSSTGSVDGSQVASVFSPGLIPNTMGNFNFDTYISFEGEFDSVRLSTAGVAFEAATAQKDVPEPTAVLGLAAIGLLGGGLLKRGQQLVG